MSFGDAVFCPIESVVRSTAANSGTGAPTREYLAQHTPESFLDRLTGTSHAGGFVLRGGILLAAYGIRRPTKGTAPTPSVPTSSPTISLKTAATGTRDSVSH